MLFKKKKRKNKLNCIQIFFFKSFVFEQKNLATFSYGAQLEKQFSFDL